jgi:hypothetical protein
MAMVHDDKIYNLSQMRIHTKSMVPKECRAYRNFLMDSAIKELKLNQFQNVEQICDPSQENQD